MESSVPALPIYSLGSSGSGDAGEGVGGNTIPTIGGRVPINSRYSGKTSPDGVEYSSNGFPDFTPYAVATVTMYGLAGQYREDLKIAKDAPINLPRSGGKP
jgi:filamentous hemagglutinin